MSITAMKQARKTFETISRVEGREGREGLVKTCTKAIENLDTAIQEAEAQPAPKQEPFGYVSEHNCQGPFQFQFHKDTKSVYTDNCKSITPVYAAPVQAQERKPLTDDKFLELLLRTGSQELVGLTTFVGGSTQRHAIMRLLRSAKLIKDFVEAAHNIKE